MNTETKSQDEQGIELMLELADDLLETIATSKIVKNDVPDWEILLLMALGKATCSVIDSLNHSCNQPGIDLLPHYKDDILPSSMMAIRKIGEIIREERQEAREHDRNLN